MAIVQIPGAARESESSSVTTPLVVLFERDDAIAVPLLSQLRLANYDVRSSRTPVELFDILSKHLVSLVLVDLGNATASRREFWVALDAQRKGRAIQVMTFRYIQPGGFFDTDFDVAPRALADVEVHGAHEFQLVVEGVRQRIPLAGSNQAFGVSGPFALGVSAPGMNAGMGGATDGYPGGIAPIGAALGVPSPFMQNPQNPAGIYDPYAAANVPTGRPMPPVHPYNPPVDVAFPQGFALPEAQQPGFPPAPAGQGVSFTQPPAHAWPFPPPVVSSSFPSGAQPAPAFGAMPFSASPFAASDPNSPFAHPIETNPFAQEAAQSPFAQPYSANPFASDLHDGGAGQPQTANPFAAPEMGSLNSRGPSALSPMGTSTPGSSEPWWAAMSGSSGSGNGDYAAGFAVAEPAARPFVSANGFAARNGNMISDVWTPPDEDFDQQTGVVPEMAFAPAPASPTPQAESPFESAWARMAERPDVEPVFRFTGDPKVEKAVEVSDETAPLAAPTRLPAVRRATPTETALGSVLVEGALLSSQRLEALKGIQQMLSSVDMNFKLGELALLFKFLSPDQLLAALLVSRGLVSPGQIAGLGRVKQELGATGMDYDLEMLLVMFHILPAEQLRQLRAELSSQQ